MPANHPAQGRLPWHAATLKLSTESAELGILIRDWVGVYGQWRTVDSLNSTPSSSTVGSSGDVDIWLRASRAGDPPKGPNFLVANLDKLCTQLAPTT
jgi:hypothetical protein